MEISPSSPRSQCKMNKITEWQPKRFVKLLKTPFLKVHLALMNREIILSTVFISEYFQKLHLIYICFFRNIKDGKIISKNKKPLIKNFQLTGLASKKKICCNKKGKIFVEKWVSVNDNLPAICKTLPFINRDLICLWIKRIYPLRKAYHQFIEDILTQVSTFERPSVKFDTHDHDFNPIFINEQIKLLHINHDSFPF